MKRITLKKKIRNYSVLAGSALASVINTDGQVIYHALIPNVVLSNGTYNLDLNGDGINDYQLREFKDGNGTTAELLPLANNASVLGTIKASHILKEVYPRAFSSGKTVQNTGYGWFGPQNFGKYNVFYSFCPLAGKEESFQAGNWNGVTNGYLPLRIKSGSHYNYGWLRMSVAEDGASIIISGYAYQETPDKPITTGFSSHLKKLSFKKSAF